MATILVVDDEASILDLLRDIIADAGHTVVAAHDGQEALALAHEHSPEVVVTDNMMPIMSGVELLHRLLANPPAPGVVLILMSAAPMPELAEFADAVRFLSKPFTIDSVLTLITRSLA